MSRIGKQPVLIPSGVTVSWKEPVLSAKGPKGQLDVSVHGDISVEVSAKDIVVSRSSDERKHRSLHGLTRALISNSIEGVSQGFTKKLEIHGTGYNATIKGKTLSMNIGFCHTVDIDFGKDIDVKVEKGKPIKMSITGIDKQKVGQLAANIRAVRPPDPYKNKGIRYAGEQLEKKEGKAFGKK
jgi:large subunit ribosomal protein L6